VTSSETLRVGEFFRLGLAAKALIVVAFEGEELEKVGLAVEDPLRGGVVSRLQDDLALGAPEACLVVDALVNLNFFHRVRDLLAERAHVSRSGKLDQRGPPLA